MGTGTVFEGDLGGRLATPAELSFDASQPLPILRHENHFAEEIYTFDVGNNGQIDLGGGNRLMLVGQSTYGAPTLYLARIEFYDE